MDEYIWLLFRVYDVYFFTDSYLAGKSSPGSSDSSIVVLLSAFVLIKMSTNSGYYPDFSNDRSSSADLFHGNFLSTDYGGAWGICGNHTDKKNRNSMEIAGWMYSLYHTDRNLSAVKS